MRQFPLSRKRAMTSRKAAEQEERDKARQRQRVAIQAQDKYNKNRFWATQMVADSQLRHRQPETTLVPKTQMSALSQLSKTLSVEMGISSDDSSSDNDSDINPEPQRSRRVKRLTRDAASQASQDRAAALVATAKSPKGKKVRKAKLMNTSQLLDEFTIE
jgi:hypothetical protein